ncbi:MAG: sensor histidine kinase [Phycisphaerales bacterium JB054]
MPPLFATLAAVAGLGALGVMVVSPGEEGWIAEQGIPLTDDVGMIVAAASGAVIVLTAFAWLGGKLRVMLHIRGALHAFGGGEHALGALKVADRPGVARAWNGLLEWRRETSDVAQVDKMLRAKGGAVQGGGGGTGERAADALWQGVVVIDEQQVMRYANGAAAVLMRQRREALPGVDVRRVITDESVLLAIGEVLETGSRQRRVMDVGDPKAGDSSVLRYSVRAIGTTGERMVLVVIEDVTQQRISDAAQHAFVAQATHELRTPLTNMQLYVEQLIDDELSPRERDSALNVINQEISRLDRIVGDMLSIAEIQAGNLHAKSGEVRVQPLLEQLQVDYAESARQKGLTLEFDLPPKYPSIVGDREKLGIVLHNLLGNAVKYTPEGGKITVSVKEEGDRLVTEVTDTGIGISEEDAARVFDRFVRANDSRVAAQTGTGLGLALARDIARLHSGDITLRSEPDVGSTFSFWLPIGGSVQAKAA